MSATAFQRMRREAEAKAKASQKQIEDVESKEIDDQADKGVQQEADGQVDAQQQEADEEVNQEQQETDQADITIKLNDMSVEELTQYAKEHGIDIGNASSQKGILKKIKEVE